MTNLDVGVGSAHIGLLDKPKVIKGSIIKSKYKKEYKKLGGLCGDDMSCELTAATTPLAIDGKVKTCLKTLRDIAIANGVWKDTYGKLNAGQQRMTVGNCLRHKIERGEKVTIGNKTMGGYEEDEK